MYFTGCFIVPFFSLIQTAITEATLIPPGIILFSFIDYLIHASGSVSDQIHSNIGESIQPERGSWQLSGK